MIVRAALLSLLLASAASAAVSTTLNRGNVCEPYVDARDARQVLPLLPFLGRVDPESIQEDPAERPEFGQVLVTGAAELIADPRSTPAIGRRVRIAYAYWLTRDGCDGWEPRSGGDHMFMLSETPAADGSYRLAFYRREGARR